jgi:hypothetical protein
VLDFNRSVTKAKAASDAINAVIDAALECEPDTPRDYLGGSALGKDCLRQLQWDWRKPAKINGKTRGIFARGHWAESYTVSCMVSAGFRIAREGDPRVEFSQLDGRFKGHADGLILAGPEIEGVTYPCLWEHKCLGEKGWSKVGKDGLKSAYPTYYAQVQIYMAYLGLEENPAIFTAVNANTMERLHLLVPFDPATAQEWSDKAVQVITATAAGETLPRVTDNPQDWRCRWCAHRVECWNA